MLALVSTVSLRPCIVEPQYATLDAHLKLEKQMTARMKGEGDGGRALHMFFLQLIFN